VAVYPRKNSGKSDKFNRKNTQGREFRWYLPKIWLLNKSIGSEEFRKYGGMQHKICNAKMQISRNLKKISQNWGL
jgi:hypothetical protein